MGLGDALEVWDGNGIKLGCDDHCTTINVMNSLNNKKKRNEKEIKCTYVHLRDLKK